MLKLDTAQTSLIKDGGFVQTFMNPPFLLQSLCFRIQKMMEVYKPDWCETREEWSVYLFSPQNKWVDNFTGNRWKIW